MLAKIGVKVNLDAKPKAQHFPLLSNLETDFYMLGWGVPTYDSEYIFNFLAHTKGEKVRFLERNPLQRMLIWT